MMLWDGRALPFGCQGKIRYKFFNYLLYDCLGQIWACASLKYLSVICAKQRRSVPFLPRGRWYVLRQMLHNAHTQENDCRELLWFWSLSGSEQTPHVIPVPHPENVGHNDPICQPNSSPAWAIRSFASKGMCSEGHGGFESLPSRKCRYSP